MVDPKPRATQANSSTEAMVKPSGPMVTTLRMSPAPTHPRATRSCATSFSSSGCQPPLNASQTSAAPIAMSPKAHMYGAAVGPTLA